MAGNSLARKAILVALLFTAAPARAADANVEIGTALASAVIGLGDNNGSIIGIPSGGLGFVNPGVYASFFVGEHFAIEPQFALLLVSSGGISTHFVNLDGQVDYFLRGSGVRSAYVFGSAGIVDVSDARMNPTSVSAGVRYRMLAGDRLAFRLDARYEHYTDQGGNRLAFGWSIGGLLGRR